MKENELRFNIRVYGILLNEKGELLLSTESRKGMRFTKFPGGGLDWGEGIRDCIQREIKEELGLKVTTRELFYVTEHFQESAFRSKDQLISIYYLLESDELHTIHNGMESLDPDELDNRFYWHSISSTNIEELTFPIDQEVFKILKQKFKSSAI